MKTVLTHVLSDVVLRSTTADAESTHRRAITLAPARGGRIAVGA